MNKNLYRIVFNKARGMLMVVADIARSGRAGSSPSSGIGHTHGRLIGKVSAIGFGLWLAMGVVQPVQANIVADRGAPKNQQPTILNSANGTPQVNIQTPSAGGVSRNSFSQFDVDQKGTILNNSRQNAQTQLGGMVTGNPWLAKGEAKIILNEVNSRDPSRLNGFIEVAGKKAQVVIANPAGITCSGCGFINANRATLTTGQVQMNNGDITGYNVERGEVVVDGAGMDTSGADYTDIIARSVKINAGLWANDLKVTTGRNKVDAEHDRIEKSAGDPATSPQLALDTSSLGGMYAGKIRMVGTENGVGVRNAGAIGAQAGSVVITADGRIENSGAIGASDDTQLASNAGITNSGTVRAGNNAGIQSQGAINNSGSVIAGNNAQLQSATLTSSKESVLAAGVKDNGQLAQKGDLRLSASGQLNAHGKTLAGGNLSVSSQGMDLSDSQTQGTQVELDAGKGNLNTQNAQVYAQQLTARTDKQLNNDGGTLGADAVTLSAQSLSNRQGEIVQTGNGDLALNLPGALNNQQGKIAANGNVNLSAQTLNNQSGNVLAAQNGNLNAQVKGKLDNRKGTLAAAGNTTVDASELDNEEGLVSASAGKGEIRSQQAINNRNGRIEAAKSQRIESGGMGNQQGVVLAEGLDLALNDGTLNNQSGILLSYGALGINSGALNNQNGSVISHGTLAYKGLAVDNSNGVFGSEQALAADFTTFLNQGGSIKSGSGMTLNASQWLDNSGGVIGAGNALSLDAGELRNRQGTLVSGDAAEINADTLDNRAGQLAAQKALTLRGERINNDDGGLIQSGDSLAVDAGELTNRNSGEKGGLIGQGSMTLAADALTNNHGLILAGNAFSLTGGQLDNTAGQLVSADALTLSLSEGLTNQSGLIQGGSVALATQGQTFNNQSGTLNSFGTLTLSSGELNNQGGTLAAKGGFDLIAADLDNRDGGRVIGESNASLHTGNLQNGGGQIQAVGDVLLDNAKGAIDNVAGLIRSGANLTLNALNVVNQNTQGANQGLEGQTVNLNTGGLNNQSGSILADNALTISNNGELNNSAGALASSGALKVSGSGLNFINRDGVVQAGTQLDIQADNVDGSGQLLSLGDMTLQSHQSFANSGTAIANGNFTLITPGSITNSGRLLAGSKLDLRGGNLTNTAAGEINAGQNWLNVDGTLLNYGLIDGGYTRLIAGTLTNTGSGRIYGDAIGVNAATFNNQAENGAAATLAGRERVDIGVQTLNNSGHSLVYSAGDMAIGGALAENGAATGLAATINNHSATIESAGNMAIAAGQINNINDNFATELVTVSSGPVTEYQHAGSPNRWNADEEGVFVDGNSSDGLRNLNTPEDTGSNNDSFSQYDYNRTVQETRIKTSDPAQILAGGNITLAGDALFNDKSQIVAGGTLETSGMREVKNDDVSGERHTSDAGWVTHYYRIRHKGTDEQGADRTAYTPPTVIQTIALKPGQLVSNGEVEGSSLNLNALTPQGIDLTIGQTGAVTAQVNGDSRAPQLQSVSAGEPVTPPPGQQFEVNPPEGTIRIVGPDTKLPDNSLFTVNPSTDVPYLVETDPRFTNEKQWLGSDYMQNAFNQSGDNTAKRLGDGYYEQRLVREQVIELTGQRYLDGYASDEEQFKALMDQGITFGKQYALKLGVALTPEQMALLTGDIVWLVNSEVNMPDGSMQTVLVPQVYAKVKPGDIDGSGALIAGNNVVMKLDGDLFNRGTIAGRRVLQLDADNITNQTGTIQGADVGLNARTDINNIGGIIQGNDSLLASAGRDINAAATVRSAESATDQNRFARTTIDSVSGIYVQGEDGKLTLQAGRDLNLTAAQVVNSGENGQTRLIAQRDLNLDTVTTASSDDLVWDSENTLKQSRRDSVGSEVVGKGDVTLAAGNDINAQAALLSSENALQLSAGHDVNIKGAENTLDLDERHKVTGSSGWLSKTTTRTHDVVSRQTVQGSELSGDKVDIKAGNDLAVLGSSVAGSGDVSLLAGNDLTVGGMSERNNEQHEKQEKKSGLMSSGGIGFSVGTQSLKVTDTGQDVTQLGSTVGSVNGDLTLGAGNNLAVTGSELVAGNDMTLSGKNVNIEAAQNQSRQTHEVEQKTSGLTLALSGMAGSALNTAVSTAQSARDTDNDRLKALQGVKATLSGVQAAQAVRMDAAQGGDAANNNTVGVSLSYGSQSSKSTQRSEQNTAQGSSLTAGNDLSISATGSGAQGQDGDLTLQGSQLKAGNNVLLAANRDINLLSAENTQQLEGKNESSGGSVGVGIGVGSGGWGISVSASVNKGKGSESGNGTTHTETTVDAGRQVTILSGRDTTLTGAQVSGETVKAEVGRNLTMTSEQDSDRYDAKQQNASAGGSFTFGSMSGSASVNLSRDKMHSNYDSVVEQTGIFAGKGGFDVTVGEHTQLNGAVIGSTATADNNRLDTGTLGFGDIHNQADYKVEHQSIGISTGGSIGSQSAGNMANGLLVGSDSEGHDSGTTRAAVSAGTITLRDPNRQTQDVADLSRDVEHANQTLSPIFDKEKEQNRLQQAQLIGEIGNQVADIARTEGQIQATNKAKAQHPNYTAEQLRETDTYKTEMQKYGTGSAVQRAIQATTAAVQGLAGGDLQAAIAGGVAPYVANVIAQTIPEDNMTGRVLAHATVNAALAAMQGKDGATAAAGAATGELMGMIATEAYGKKVGELSEEEKQTISALATLASGLAGGLVGDSSASALAGAQSGKTTIDNNFFSPDSMPQGLQDYGQSVSSLYTNTNLTDEEGNVLNPVTEEERQYAMHKLVTGTMPEGQDISKAIVDGYTNGVLIAGAWYLGPAASIGKVAVSSALSGGANAAYQWYDLSQPGNENKTYDYWSTTAALVTGGLAPGRNILPNVGIAMGGAVFTDGPSVGTIGSAAAGSWAGGAFGKYAPEVVQKAIGSNPVPEFIYEVGGAFTSEVGSKAAEDLIDRVGERK
ncbi:hemagglutinin repeat-containing protein [Brenneria goodwinii]|uniref:hemagglutinin repeat-containing protein n=1 Tax=Brenneria goodwinii TaxID=1109412 RepID=UPI000EF223F5|nr:hemagglutinin repeat-containing protein [Brenneria goodwinii]MCG8156218.1 hemagglutinin repeat-containing protein [Brenneria goodwinii]MCG8160863.1 hemagglutinin repeat-containing protein [Brenneria goodwinii]MCG8167753.1 hemagglutinin repeat-containing protein [Brenneria goodwinii]MCG8172376.1 hemagglutinin repeat-containing protein [Brenneria goodwinii]MCG8177194.1 hemagglutinin repeat-containing protein [Brenneria goodwinii]